MRVARAANATKSWLVRWQEHLLWVPLALFGIAVSWLVISGLGRVAMEWLSPVIELFIRALYAVTWLSLIYLARRRFRRKLTEQEQIELWLSAKEGRRGAMFLVALDALVWIVAGGMLLPFFWLAH